MARIELTADRFAQAEVEDEPNVLTVRDREFKLVSAAPAAFIVGMGRLQKGDMSGLEMSISCLLQDPTEIDDVLVLGLDIRDLAAVAAQIYGIDVGEALASA